MNIIIVDDEKLARKRLSSIIEQIPGCRTVGYASNGLEAVDKAQNQHVDLMLMDISLPEMSGLEAARRINELVHPPFIIFTTAFSEYALQAFSNCPAGYLLKPVRASQLEKVLSGVRRPRLRAVAEPVITTREENNYVYCRQQDNLLLVALTRIFYMQSYRKYTRIFHDGGTAYSETPLKHFEKIYAERMLRIHRATLVNKSYLLRLESSTTPGVYQVKLSGVAGTLPVSRRNLAPIRGYLRTFMSAEEVRFDYLRKIHRGNSTE